MAAAPSAHDEQELQAVGVLGPIRLEELGAVLASEVLVGSLRGLCVASDDVLRCAPLSMANLGALRHAPLACDANLDLTDPSEAADELRSMLARGAARFTLVDATPIGCGRDLAALRALAAQSNGRARVVASTGHGSERHGLAGWLRGASEEEIAAPMLRELLDGIELAGLPAAEPPPRAGAIVAAVSATPTALELKLLRAAALASRRSLAPVFVELPLFEPPTDGLPARVLAELEAAGAEPARVCVVVGALSLAALVAAPEAFAGAVLRAGASVCVGSLGMPDVWLPAADGLAAPPSRLPHDGEIAAAVCAMLAAGHGDLLLLSTGVRMRLQRERFGGGGYGHLRDFFAPLLRSAGVDAAALSALTERNAARLLGWWRPPPPAGRSTARWVCVWCLDEHEGPLHAHERIASDQVFYEKFGGRYCSTACLSHHRQLGFKPRGAATAAAATTSEARAK
jgi:phosphotriesterase-related protein